MSLLDEFKWKKYGMGTCMICQEVKGGWYLMTKEAGGICMKCCASITTMHNLKEDEIL